MSNIEYRSMVFCLFFKKEIDMGIATRIVKIFKADIHGVMDQFEDRGLLLKQYLRDMEDALNQKEVALARKVARKNQVQKKHHTYVQQHQAFDHDLTVAVEKGQDDIARVLIRKTKSLEGLCDELADQAAVLDEEISQDKQHLSEQRLQYEQLKIRSAEFFHRTEMQGRERPLGDVIPSRIPAELSEEEIELELLKRKEALRPN
jgi:phage shock protein A